jgi:hypothetical protein
VDLNLDTLKREILEYLESAGFAVFRGSSGGLEGLPMLLWDSETYPDFQMFLEVAQHCGIKLVIFASQTLESDDLDELVSQLEECELDRDERREYERRLRDLRKYVGVTCSLELAFDYHSRLYVYEMQPDWYDDFLSIDDELTTRSASEDEDGDDGSLGGYFSNN